MHVCKADGSYGLVWWTWNVERAQVMYNLTVDVAHTYFVGQGQWLVHNCGGTNNLASPQRTTHILDGDATGGGHRAGTGISGNTEFPAGWSDDKIMETISDVATDPTIRATPSKWGRWIMQGIRDGIEIKVVISPNWEDIITAYPVNLPKNP